MKKSAAILFLVLGTFLFSEKASEKEPLDFSVAYRRIPEISTTLVSLNKESKSITILLSDGSSWYTDLDSYEILEEWQEGDDIRWKEQDNAFLLKRARSSKAIVANIDYSNRPSNCYKIDEIDQNGYLIVTNSDDYWSVGYWGAFSTQYWKKGDPLLINKSNHRRCEDYELLNMKRGNRAWASLVKYK